MINRKEADKLLHEAAIMNPGLWINHSKNVAIAAMKITKHCHGKNPEKAYYLGLLHDIGRRFGISHFKHTLDGYYFLEDKDLFAAEICLTHSFPNKKIEEYQGEIDVELTEKEFVINKLKVIEYEYYTKLIILCDSYGMHEGFIPLEKRWIDVTIRLGINQYTTEKWNKIYEFRKQLNTEYKIDIEQILKIKS